MMRLQEHVDDLALFDHTACVQHRDAVGGHDEHDLADLWERAAVDGTPIADIVGDDPVEYAESYAEAYGGTQWVDKERARLIGGVMTIDSAPGMGTAISIHIPLTGGENT